MNNWCLFLIGVAAALPANLPSNDDEADSWKLQLSSKNALLAFHLSRDA
ncbi:MAG: hypothetical protein P1U68_16105 [Verrucomicrobiales bacterium]|nr:hypothetical protein [Verrucomicrobiales bacterium]